MLIEMEVAYYGMRLRACSAPFPFREVGGLGALNSRLRPPYSLVKHFSPPEGTRF
jgi:hypothetical protein